MGFISVEVSPELKAFLEAEDLDDLLEARSKLRQLDEFQSSYPHRNKPDRVRTEPLDHYSSSNL